MAERCKSVGPTNWTAPSSRKQRKYKITRFFSQVSLCKSDGPSGYVIPVRNGHGPSGYVINLSNGDGPSGYVIPLSKRDGPSGYVINLSKGDGPSRTVTFK